MKQNITISQLNELSEKGKERLREWALDKDYIEWTNKCHDEECNCAFLTDPLLSIGQMIEFLLDHGENLRDRFMMEEDFCDEIWGDVKEILEK